MDLNSSEFGERFSGTQVFSEGRFRGVLSSSPGVHVGLQADFSDDELVEEVPQSVAFRLYSALRSVLGLTPLMLNLASSKEGAVNGMTFPQYVEAVTLAGKLAPSKESYNSLRLVNGLYLAYLMSFPPGYDHLSGNGYDVWARVLGRQATEQSTPVSMAPPQHFMAPARRAFRSGMFSNVPQRTGVAPRDRDVRSVDVHQDRHSSVSI